VTSTNERPKRTNAERTPGGARPGGRNNPKTFSGRPKKPNGRIKKGGREAKKHPSANSYTLKLNGRGNI